MFGQVKPLEHRLRYPATAIVRSQRAVLDDHHACIGHLDSLFAWRNQNPEVGDGGFWPLAETFGHCWLVSFVHGIELSALGRGACTDETEANSFEVKGPHAPLHFVLLVIFELSRRNIEAGNANAGIEPFEERVFELLLPWTISATSASSVPSP